MDHFAGLDVSVKETSVCIVDEWAAWLTGVKICDNSCVSCELQSKSLITLRNAPKPWLLATRLARQRDLIMWLIHQQHQHLTTYWRARLITPEERANRS